MADLVMPKLGLTMTEGLLAEWLVGPGDAFAAGDLLFVVETEKIANEIEAQSPGRVEAILVAAGETVPVGTPVARLSGDAGAAAGDPGPAEGNRVVATPLARRLATQHGVDLATVAGSGPNGRVKAADVERSTAATAAPAPARPLTAAPPPTSPRAAGAGPATGPPPD